MHQCLFHRARRKSVALVEQKALVAIHIGVAHHNFQFLIAHDGVPPCSIQRVHLLLHLDNQRVGFADGVLA